MAQKKTKARPKKRVTKKKGNKKKNAFLSSLKQFMGWVTLTISLFVGLFFFYDCTLPQSKGSAYDKVKAAVTSAIEEKQESITPTTATLGLEQSRLLSDARQQVIHHEGYSVSYNPEYRIPNWVAWELTRTEVETKIAERHTQFAPDPEVDRWATAYDEDYRGSGFDRGHMAPAADMKWSHQSMRETFYFSNICPQDRKMNSGIWNNLEQKCRSWAKKHQAVYIVSGPVIHPELRRLGKNRVAIPEQFYKVICTLSDNKYQGVAFLLENREYTNTSLRSVALPIDSVEQVTGIDFFFLLDDKQEAEMERKVDMKFWF